MLVPDLYYRSVLDIDLAALSAQGVTTLLMDLDNTLLPRDTSVVPDEVRAWAQSLSSRGMKACLVSNNWHERVHGVAGELGFDLVSKAIKPLPFAFWIALKRAGATRRPPCAAAPARSHHRQGRCAGHDRRRAVRALYRPIPERNGRPQHPARARLSARTRPPVLS